MACRDLDLDWGVYECGWIPDCSLLAMASCGMVLEFLRMWYQIKARLRWI
jgi:hypothetical protein